MVSWAYLGQTGSLRPGKVRKTAFFSPIEPYMAIGLRVKVIEMSVAGTVPAKPKICSCQRYRHKKLEW